MTARVVGVGNPTRRDDRVGLVVAREIAGRVGDDVEVTELCRGGLALAEALLGCDAAVVVDAMESLDAPAGALLEPDLRAGPRTWNAVCSHDADVVAAMDLLRALGYPVPARVAIVGVVAEDLDTFGETLTPAVERAVPAATDRVLEILQAWAATPPEERP